MFSSVEIEFTMDKDFTMLSENYLETYTLKYTGIAVQLNATYKASYKY